MKDEKIKAIVAEMLDGVIAPIDFRLKVIEAIIGPVDQPMLKALIAEVVAPLDARLKALEAIIGPSDILVED